jgi:hypothetical protein
MRYYEDFFEALDMKCAQVWTAVQGKDGGGGSGREARASGRLQPARTRAKAAALWALVALDTHPPTSSRKLGPWNCLQVLVTLDNLANRSQYLNVRNTFQVRTVDSGPYLYPCKEGPKASLYP